jgi:hypothetical protein
MGRLRRRATVAQKGIAQILETASEYGLQGEESQLARDARGLARAFQRPERQERRSQHTRDIAELARLLPLCG